MKRSGQVFGVRVNGIRIAAKSTIVHITNTSPARMMASSRWKKEKQVGERGKGDI